MHKYVSVSTYTYTLPYDRSTYDNSIYDDAKEIYIQEKNKNPYFLFRT